MKHQTSKAHTVLAKVHYTPMFTSTKHNRDSKKCQQAQTYLHTHKHTALAEQPGKHKHTHTRTPAAHTSTYAALCTRTSTHTQAHKLHCAQEQAQALLRQGRHKASCSRHLARGKRETKCSLGRLHAALMNKSHFVAYAHNTAYIP